ncbi:hypothetical protein ALC57_01006, partial [Trachymyrmex cornetzi]
KDAKITNTLIYMIVKDNMSLNNTDKQRLQYFMKITVPLYSVPGRNKITFLIDAKYDHLSGVIKEKLRAAMSITLTTDVWTEIMNTIGYLGLTAHLPNDSKKSSITIGVIELNERHIATYLGEMWSTTCNEWNILLCNILLIVVTDNIPNICKAAYDVFGKKKQLSSTRWTSIFYMLERFLILIVFQVLNEIMNMLKPFELVSKEICGQKYVTCSVVISMVNALLHELHVKSGVRSGQRFKTDALSLNFKNDFITKSNSILSIATILDPRFKRLHFCKALAHPDYQEQNIIELVDVLQNNGYPLNVIFSTINNRIEKLAKRKNLYINNKMLDDSNSNNNNYYFLVPYIRNFSEKFFHIAHKMNKKVAFKAHNNLNSIIKLGKDQLKTNEQKGVVYKINCKECDVSYVGQTKRKMGTRIFEHQQDIKNKKHCSSVLAEHQMNNGHNFNWDDIKIMAREQYLFKRLTSEMIFIKKQENGLNRQNDTQKEPPQKMPVFGTSIFETFIMPNSYI